MIRRWFGIVLMLWASVASLLAFAPNALANGEQYTLTGANTIQASGGSFNGTVTFNSVGGGNFNFLILSGGASKAGPTETIYTISGLKAVAGGAYSAKISCSMTGAGGGGSCPSLTNPLTIANPNHVTPTGGPAPTAAAPAAPAAPAGPTAAAADTCTGGGALGWVLCPIVNLMVEMVGWIETNFLQPFLSEPPFDQNSAQIHPVYLIWTAFRNLASVFFILVFFMVIFGTAIGFDNYTVKKVLPHLIAGAILVPFSWYICAIGIDIGNVIGQGLNVLMNSIIKAPAIDFGTNLESLFYAAGAVLLASLAVIGMSMGILFTVLIAATATYFTLILRKLLIILLVILSPFAILAWILPNTQKMFKMWYSNLTRLILMYPLIMLLFEAGRLFATVAGSAANATGPGSNAITPLIQLTGLFLPLAMVPWTFSMAGSAMKFGSNGIGKVSGAANKKWGRGSESDKKRHENFQNKRAFNATSGNAFMRGLARKQSGTGGFVMNGAGVPWIGKDEHGNRNRIMKQGQQSKSEMMDKADKYRALNDKTTGYDEANRHSPINKERQLQAGTNEASAKTIEARAKETLHSNLTIDNVEVAKDANGVGITATVTAQVGNHGLGGAQRAKLRDLAEKAVTAGDQGAAAGYLQALSKTASGRSEMAWVQDNMLDHNKSQEVAAKYKEMWDTASEGVDSSKNPGLKKNLKSAYEGINPADMMKMDPPEKGRYFKYARADGNDQARDEAGNAIGTALRSDRTRERLNDDDYREIHEFTSTARGLSALLKANNETAAVGPTSPGGKGNQTYEHLEYIRNRVT